MNIKTVKALIQLMDANQLDCVELTKDSVKLIKTRHQAPASVEKPEAPIPDDVVLLYSAIGHD